MGVSKETKSNSPLGKLRRRLSNSRWNKILLYDCDTEKFMILSDQYIGQYLKLLQVPTLKLTKHQLPSDNRWQKLEIPPPPDHHCLVVLVDRETESQVTLEQHDANGRSNTILVTLLPGRMGARYRVRRFLGLLSTLYVANVAPWIETPSRNGQEAGGTGEDDGAVLAASG